MGVDAEDESAQSASGLVGDATEIFAENELGEEEALEDQSVGCLLTQAHTRTHMQAHTQAHTQAHRERERERVRE